MSLEGPTAGMSSLAKVTSVPAAVYEYNTTSAIESAEFAKRLSILAANAAARILQRILRGRILVRFAVINSSDNGLQRSSVGLFLLKS